MALKLAGKSNWDLLYRLVGTTAKPDDQEYNLVRKLLVLNGGTPDAQDTLANLWSKIVTASGATPSHSDSVRDSLRKIMVQDSLTFLADDTINDMLKRLITPSSDANLTKLFLSSGTLSPTFTSGTISYTEKVPYSVASVTAFPTLDQDGATIQAKVGAGAYANVLAGGPSSPLPLALGDNTVSVQVTAEDGTVKTYTVTVRRLVSLDSLVLTGATLAKPLLILSPSFSSVVLSYTAGVSNPINAVTVTPTSSQPGSLIEVKVGAGSYAAVASGADSAPLDLAVGANTISVRTTSADTLHTDIYQVVVTRAA